MGNFTDLTGKTFNRLTVLHLATTKTIDKKLKWVCKCICGTIHEVRGLSLTKGTTQSCGCWHKEFNKHRTWVVTEITKNKHRLNKLGDKNPMWIGDNIKGVALHNWIRRHKPKPDFCVDCKVKVPFDLANISQEYHRDINDFEWLCRSCHMKKDGRLARLHSRKR